MFMVPSVTMKAGNPIPVTRLPFSMPKAIATTRPSSIASQGLSPRCAAKLAIRTPASAITMPLDRSMPVVMITRV